MAHDKVYGYCENMCKVEVPAKENTDQLCNENLLLGADFVNQMANNIGECWTLNNFMGISNTGLMITPNNSGYIEQDFSAVWIASGNEADFFPITLSLECSLGSVDVEHQTISVTFDELPDINTKTNLLEITSGKFLTVQFPANADARTIKFEIANAIGVEVFVIYRIKVEHGTRFTGWASTLKDSLIMRKINELYYSAGDEISASVNTSGYVTSGGNVVRFTLPLSKPVMGTPTVTVTNANFTLRQAGKYTHGSSASSPVNPDSITATINQSGLNIAATFSNTTDAVNNDVIGIAFAGTITFE